MVKPQTTAHPTDRFAWLIERNSTLFGTEWFCAGKDRWTKDANKAIQFSDKEAAEETQKLFRPDIPSYPHTEDDASGQWKYHLSITEHGWM